MESAKVRITVTVKPGLRNSCRTENLRFCPSIPIEAPPSHAKSATDRSAGRDYARNKSSLYGSIQAAEVQLSVRATYDGTNVAEPRLRAYRPCPLPNILVREWTGAILNGTPPVIFTFSSNRPILLKIRSRVGEWAREISCFQSMFAGVVD